MEQYYESFDRSKEAALPSVAVIGQATSPHDTLSLYVEHLSDEKVCDEIATHVSSLVAGNGTLTTLNISDNLLGPALGERVASALGKNSSLKTVSMLGNRIGRTAGIHVAAAAEKHPSLSTLAGVTGLHGDTGGSIGEVNATFMSRLVTKELLPKAERVLKELDELAAKIRLHYSQAKAGVKTGELGEGWEEKEVNFQMHWLSDEGKDDSISNFNGEQSLKLNKGSVGYSDEATGKQRTAKQRQDVCYLLYSGLNKKLSLDPGRVLLGGGTFLTPESLQCLPSNHKIPKVKSRCLLVRFDAPVALTRFEVIGIDIGGKASFQGPVALRKESSGDDRGEMIQMWNIVSPSTEEDVQTQWKEDGFMITDADKEEQEVLERAKANGIGSKSNDGELGNLKRIVLRLEKPTEPLHAVWIDFLPKYENDADKLSALYDNEDEAVANVFSLGVTNMQFYGNTFVAIEAASARALRLASEAVSVYMESHECVISTMLGDLALEVRHDMQREVQEALQEQEPKFKKSASELCDLIYKQDKQVFDEDEDRDEKKAPERWDFQNLERQFRDDGEFINPMMMEHGSDSGGLPESFCSPNLFAQSVDKFAFKFALDKVPAREPSVEIPLSYEKMTEELSRMTEKEVEELDEVDKEQYERTKAICAALKKCWSCVQELRAAYLRSSTMAAVDWSESRITLDSVFELVDDTDKDLEEGAKLILMLKHFVQIAHLKKEEDEEEEKHGKEGNEEEEGKEEGFHTFAHSFLLRELSYLWNTPEKKRPGKC